MFPRFRIRSLGTRIIVWFFVPTAFILIAVALVTYYAYQQVTSELVIERNRELTRLSAGNLAAGLAEYSDLLEPLARTISIHQGDLAAQQDALVAASNRLAVFDAGILIIDTFGTVVAAEPDRPDVLGQDWSSCSYYREVLRSHILGMPEPVFSDIVDDGPGGADVVVVAVPVTGTQGEFLGTVTGMFEVGASAVSTFYGNIVKLRIGDGGTTYLVDGNGWVIYHSDTDKVGENFSRSATVQQLADQQVGAIRARNIEGENIVASFASVQGTSWSLVSEESWSSLTSGSRSYQNFLLLLLVSGVALPVLVVAVGIRRVMQPIQELIKAAQEVARGKFGQSIEAQTGDEIEELAKQFNIMSAQLEESYAHLEQRVADRTRELAVLNDIAAVVSRSLDLQEIMSNALAKTLDLLEIEAGGIYLLQEETDLLTIAASKGFSQDVIPEIDNLSIGEGFSGRVAETGEVMSVRDISADPRLTRLAASKIGLRSLASFPLVSRGKVLGTMFVSTREYRDFSSTDIELLSSIGHQIGVAVENAKLFAQSEQRLQELGALYRADEEMHRYLDLDRVLNTLVDVAIDILGADKSSLMIWDDKKEKLIVRAARGFQAVTMEQIGFARDEGLAGRVAITGEPAIVEDVRSSSEVTRWIVDAEQIESFMHVPITIGGEIFGVFNVDYTRPKAFGKEEQRLFVALAQRAALAIQNAQLYQQAQQSAALEERQRLARDLHDAVTQTLFSSSLIAEVLPRLWARNQEEGLRRLTELRQLTRGALAEMRTLLVELRPAALMEADLGELLHQLGEAITGRTRVPVQVSVKGECPLPVDVKVALYRIAQEALNNVAKHAEASEVKVDMQLEPGSADMRIQDDGIGFDTSVSAPDRLGMGIMQERAEAIGAKLDVTSQPGAGTKVSVSWSDTGQRNDGPS
ncbi:MAG: GAF domain-containing protein [Anaerolineales bacterium]